MTLTQEPAEATAGQVAARRWRASRGVLLAVLALFAVAFGLAVLRPSVRPQYLDPESPGQAGTRALAQILGAHGTPVRVARNVSAARDQMNAAPDSVLVVTRSERLTPADVDALRSLSGDLLLVEPTQDTLLGLAPGVNLAARTFQDDAQPGCDLAAATQAGTVRLSGAMTYQAPESATACYLADGLPRLLQMQIDGRMVTVLGSGAPLTNGELADDGNAALGMNLAGARSSVVWLIPDLPPPGTASGERSVGDLVPFGAKLAILQLLIAVVLAALWRVRRLGPVVNEPLPIVVRSAEAVEGRARLYRSRRATGSAADALRAGTRERLVGLLGLPRAAAQDPGMAQEIVIATAARTRLDATTIGAALYGPAPADDAELVRLTDFLDDLERQVRQS